MNGAPSDRRDRGAVIPIVALSLGLIMVMTAFSIDLGRQILRRRDMQAIADVVSLDMARLVNGRTRIEILTAIDPNWNTELSLSAQRNAFTASGLTAKLGDVVNDVFVENTLDSSRPTAVQITAADTVNFYFVPGNGNVTRSATSVAGGTACYSVGSFAAALQSNQSALAPLLNNALNVSGVSYNGLAALQVNLGDIAANLGFGTPTDMLTSSVGTQDFILAEADALDSSGHTAEATVLRNIATGVNGSSSFNFGDFMNATQGQGAALDVAFNALNLLSGALALSNGTHSLSATNVSLAGVGNFDVQVTEAPSRACGPIGSAQTQTSQIRATMRISVPVGLQTLNITIVFQTANSAGNLANPLSCGPPGQVNVSVANSLVTQTVTATLGAIPIPLSVTAPSSNNGGTVHFDVPPVLPQTKTTGSGPLGIGTISYTGGIPGVGLVMGAVNTLVGQLNTNVVNPLSKYAGLTIAGADVTAHSMTCNEVSLAV